VVLEVDNSLTGRGLSPSGVIENLNAKGLASGMLSKAVQDAGWASVLSKMAYRVERRVSVLKTKQLQTRLS
jgi:hypothetical protein